jgi:hypothetical protein
MIAIAQLLFVEVFILFLAFLANAIMRYDVGLMPFADKDPSTGAFNSHLQRN